MKIHHLNCGTMCPLLGGLATGHDHMVCHCWLVESEQGLVLVDSGIGLADVSDPKHMSGVFRGVVRPQLKAEETARRQVEALGFKGADVRHIIVTHLDLDHAGGLADFPEATVHVFADELEAALHPSWREKHRYLPHHWAHQIKWQRYETVGEPWLGLPAVRSLNELSDDFLIVPLPGHTRGHVGVAVNDGSAWNLHAGDAYFHHNTIEGQTAPWGLRLFESSLAVNNQLRLSNAAKLAELHRTHPEVNIVCAHDPEEFGACGTVSP